MTTKIVFTDGKETKTIFKSLDPFTDETPGVWTGGTDLSKQAQSNRLVPSMYAGVVARMQAMADLPFTIYNVKGDKEIDNSDDYQNILGFLPYPSRTFALTEGSLVNSGRAYWFKGTGAKTGQIKELKYWIPSSVTLDTAALKKGIILFKREGVNQPFTVDQVLYMWLLDSDVEIGPPLIWPLASALTAAQANGAITKWIADYMLRGAVKAMLLMVDGMPPPGEVERIETWFNRFMNGTRGLMWKVFNSAGVKPTIIGEGMDSLKDLGISRELRYEIHTALGTRHLLEDENLATANARERQFYTITVVPDARLIQYAMNEQILHKTGFHLEFEPERLEVFQDNEGEQAEAFSKLFDVFSKAMSTDAAFQLASEKLDYQFTDEQLALIKKGMSEKQAKDEEIAKQMQDNAAQVDDKGKPIEKKPIPPKQNPVAVRKMVELDKWRDKNEKAGKIVKWHAVDLSADVVKSIMAGDTTIEEERLKLSQSQDEMLFIPQVSEAAQVLEGIRLALAK